MILHAFTLLPKVIFGAILEMVTWELLKKNGLELFIPKQIISVCFQRSIAHYTHFLTQ